MSDPRKQTKRRRRILAVGSMAVILAAATPPTWQAALLQTIIGKAIEHGASAAWTMITDALATNPQLADPKVAARTMEKPAQSEPQGRSAERQGNAQGPGRCGEYSYWSTVEQVCKDARDK